MTVFAFDLRLSPSPFVLFGFCVWPLQRFFWVINPYIMHIWQQHDGLRPVWSIKILDDLNPFRRRQLPRIFNEREHLCNTTQTTIYLLINDYAQYTAFSLNVKCYKSSGSPGINFFPHCHSFDIVSTNYKMWLIQYLWISGKNLCCHQYILPLGPLCSLLHYFLKITYTNNFSHIFTLSSHFCLFNHT